MTLRHWAKGAVLSHLKRPLPIFNPLHTSEPPPPALDGPLHTAPPAQMAEGMWYRDFHGFMVVGNQSHS